MSCLLLVTTFVFAVPVRRDSFRLRLSDGTERLVYFAGDEHHSWLQTQDGQVVEEYAPRSFRLSQRSVADELRVASARRMTAAQQAPRRIGSQATAPLPSTGSPKVPVVLVNFADSVFTVGETDEEVRQYYDLYCNGTRDGNRYTGHKSYGSIRDYFSDQSDNQFTPEFVIIGPVTLENPESYYGSNSGTKDIRYSQMTREVIAKATEIYDGDWMNFDNRGKGKVDMVFFIFAGCGENTSHVGTDIWPKEFQSAQTINGIVFSTSACCSEKAATVKRVDGAYVVTGSSVDGIGVMCHELSHALGLPDFYNTRYEAFGMDLWSLMDYGCYAGGSKCPCSYTSYEREFMGWSKMEELTEPGWYTIQPTEAGFRGMKIVNDENSNEYYVLDNRQRVGWDTSLASRGHGLQVTHVDFLQSAWNSNGVNSDAKHQRMTIIAANNNYNGTYRDDITQQDLLEAWAGNLFPYIYEDENGEAVTNDSLTAESTPAATVFTAGGFMHKDLHAIRENDDMSVTFYYGNDYVAGITNGVDAIGTEETVNSSSSKLKFFDLSGRTLSGTPKRGIYISGGRKILVR